ncbi:MAG TPA: endonuclease III [Kofleriaceae bacterium]|nr:endonuclease III [Kofleriaceae bacterium]
MSLARPPVHHRARPAPAKVRTKAERAAVIESILDAHFPQPAIPLDHADPFQLLVATVLSAQCTDARVNQVTPGLFACARDAATMATLSAADILPHIKTCGLAPSKAKNLAALARKLVAEHRGLVPAQFSALEALPGVGHKTASVVMAQAFGVPAFPVDTHIFRLARRWQLSRGDTVERVERDLKAAFPAPRWNLLHLQIIYFGRAYCPARGHDPDRCPICAWAMSEAARRRERREGRSA